MNIIQQARDLQAVERALAEQKAALDEQFARYHLLAAVSRLTRQVIAVAAFGTQEYTYYRMERTALTLTVDDVAFALLDLRDTGEEQLHVWVQNDDAEGPLMCWRPVRTFTDLAEYTYTEPVDPDTISTIKPAEIVFEIIEPPRW